MTRTILQRLPIVILAASVSACVSQSEFDAYVKHVGDMQAILFCETRNDAYEDMVDSDEPNPTRRDETMPRRHDEPRPTRRDLDSCEEEYDDMVDSGSFGTCKVKMVSCADNTSHGTPACRSCYAECLNTGTWPDAQCPLP